MADQSPQAGEWVEALVNNDALRLVLMKWLVGDAHRNELMHERITELIHLVTPFLAAAPAAPPSAGSNIAQAILASKKYYPVVDGDDQLLNQITRKTSQEWLRQAFVKGWRACTAPAPPSASAARIAALEKVLEPFASIADTHWPSTSDEALVYVMLGVCRSARALLSTKEGDNG